MITRPSALRVGVGGWGLGKRLSPRGGAGVLGRDYHQEPRYKATSSCALKLVRAGRKGTPWWGAGVLGRDYHQEPVLGERVPHAVVSLFVVQIWRETACDNNYDYCENDDKCLV